jgi:XTP/dITP diphosphohydrolase
VLGLSQVQGVPDDVEETGQTFADNAVLKAVTYGAAAGMPTLADDSGLQVDALQGAPGVYSARFAGPGASDADNNALLLSRLEGLAPEARTAQFVCVLALYVPEAGLAEALARRAVAHPQISALPAGAGLPGAVFTTSGTTRGRILEEARGQGGFGYDPLFLSDDLGVSFAQAHEGKKSVSHRARALATMMPWLIKGR